METANFDLSNELTERELSVLLMLADGNGVSQIAEETGRAISTIKHQAQSIRWKLHARNNAHAVARAYHLGILRSMR